jgi:hypothetical protein
MKTRICILATTAIAVLGGPAAQVAGAMIPADPGGSSTSRHASVANPTSKATKSTTAIKVGHYNRHAYVHGGASQKVAKAITAAGKASAVSAKASDAAGRWTFP